jgi:hypothetical protein
MEWKRIWQSCVAVDIFRGISAARDIQHRVEITFTDISLKVKNQRSDSLIN